MLKTLINNRDNRLAFWIALAIVFLASVPYIFGYAVTPSGYRYIGFTYNVDDASVYLSWMRQAADGHFFQRNLFTTEPQRGHGFNLLFYFIGSFGRFTHMPLIGVFHLFRVLFGLMLLLSVYAISGIWFQDARARRLCLIVTGLSAGFGWVMPMKLGINYSCDTWQPEVITFQSVYLSPLYIFPTLLMLWTVYCLHRLDESGSLKYAIRAGFLLLLLANIHTYDLITVALIWIIYAITALTRRHSKPLLGGLVAAGIAMPLAAYQVYFYHTEPIFRMRAAVPTLTPSFYWYLMGYGLLIPLALAGVWVAVKGRKNVLLLMCWIAAGFTAMYLPVSYQRKLVMGTHIPLSILAAIGLYELTRWRLRILSASAITAVVFLMSITNLRFLARDMNRIMNNESHTVAHVPFISPQEIEMFEFIRTKLSPNSVILAPPGTAILVPGYTGKIIYAGHWGETVKYKEKLVMLLRFYLSYEQDLFRRKYLRETKVDYVIGYHAINGIDGGSYDSRKKCLPYLRPVFDRPEVSVYEVLHDKL